MKKRTVLVVATVGVAVLTAAMGFIAYTSVVGRTTGDVVVLSDARREARQLVQLCDNVEGVKIQLAEGTSHFEVYIASDVKKGRETLADIVMPVIDSRTFACTSAQSDLAKVKRAAKVADPFVDDAIPRIDAMVTKLAKAKSAGTELLAAFDRNAPAPELLAKLAPLRSAMN